MMYKEPQLGDVVYASMIGYPVYHGVLEKVIDLFCPYSVRCDDGELRYFTIVELEHIVEGNDIM